MSREVPLHVVEPVAFARLWDFGLCEANSSTPPSRANSQDARRTHPRAVHSDRCSGLEIGSRDVGLISSPRGQGSKLYGSLEHCISITGVNTITHKCLREDVPFSVGRLVTLHFRIRAYEPLGLFGASTPQHPQHV